MTDYPRLITIGSVCGQGGVAAGRHVFPWVRTGETTADDGATVTTTTYYEPPNRCQCGEIKEATFRESGA